MKTSKIIAITGGIGSGKSVVSRVLRVMGYPVYDCDSRARALMDSDAEMKQRIADEISPMALCADGSLNRPALAQVVFSTPQKLARLNAIVHGAVAADCRAWAQHSKSPVVFVETAILYASRMDSLMSDVWEVTAPEELRIQRVMARNGFTREQVAERIASQKNEFSHPSHKIIVNDTSTPVVPQIISLLQIYGTIA
jgi:dephospho-CoA kinase